MSKCQDLSRSQILIRLLFVKIEAVLEAQRRFLLLNIFCCLLFFLLFTQAQATQNRCINGALCIASGEAAASLANTPARMIDNSSPPNPESRQFIEQDRCSDLPIAISGATFNEHRLACAAARQALSFLGICSLFPLDTIRVRITPNLQHPEKGKIFGMYNTDSETVVITAVNRIPPLIAGTPYDVVPEREFFHSLVVHEVTHAVLHRQYWLEPQSQSAHEYPAYVLQYKSLSEDTRTRLLSEIGATVVSNPVFNDLLLAMNPFRFGAMAYQHHVRATDGCAFFQQLLRNEAKFVWATPQL